MGEPVKTDATLRERRPGGMSATQFEALCVNCTKCCYQKIIVDRSVIITPFPCQFLDVENRRCRVYAERRKYNPHCLGVLEGLQVSAFPESCPYVRHFAPASYRPAIDTWSWSGQWHDFDALADDLKVPTHIREVVRARGPEAKLPWDQGSCRNCDRRV